jgi:trigger factor
MADHAIPARSLLEEMPSMSTDELQGGSSASVADAPPEPEVETPKRKLELEVAITDVGPCRKHLKVTIPRSEIDLQYEKSLEELRRDVLVPGFRQGRAPRQLVVKRFRKQVSEQVKSSLLMSSLEQIDNDYKLEPIVQPRLDAAAIELPDEGPMNFEMDVEVRPQFNLPTYQGLKVKRPVAELSEHDVEVNLQHYLEGHGQIVPKTEGAAEIGDYITADLLFHGPDGRVVDKLEEAQFRLQSELRFQNGAIPGVGPAIAGARPGETRQVEAVLGSAVDDPALRSTKLDVQVHVKDLKRLRLPEMNQSFLDSIGIENSNKLREAVRDTLERRIRIEQRQSIRRQVLDILLHQTPFDLPNELVMSEEKSTISKLVSQLKREGMSDNEIRASEAQIRANAHESTLRSLKELLLLAKIAEAEGIKVGDEELSLEIEAIADRTDESVRRVRARVEKEGGSDSLASQILERKVIDRILEHTEIEDMPTKIERPHDVETLDYTLTTAASQESQPETGTSGEQESPHESS